MVVLGKLPPPYMGPAIATRIILNSRLSREFQLHHLDTRAHEHLPAYVQRSVAKIGRNLKIYVRLARMIRRVRPALVLVPISQSTIGFVKDSAFIWIARALRRPIVVQLRGANLRRWLAESSVPVRWYVKAAVRQASAAIVLGESLRTLFHGLVPDDRVFVVPNGADYRFPPRIPSADGCVRFLFLANLRRAKGIADLVAAASLLKQRGVAGFRIDVVGEWTDESTRAACTRRVADECLPVTFHGPRYDEDKLRCFSAADVFIFVPREPEGHPWVIVEAMAAGLPLIATDRGAICESLIAGYNGILADSTAESVAAAMQTFISAPGLIARMGAASLRHHREHFSESRMVERLSAVFHEVLKRH